MKRCITLAITVFSVKFIKTTNKYTTKLGKHVLFQTSKFGIFRANPEERDQQDLCHIWIESS